MKQLIGQQIGQYQVEALLGEGGMGAVYRAHDLKHGRMVALKIMLANLSNKPQFRSRFMQEAEAIAHFSSPAIIAIFDTGTYEESPYIVMEYIEGGSLIDYMRQLDWSGAKPTVETVTTVAAQVAEGLSYAHQRGLIHRDVKPGNVLLKMREGAYQPRQTVISDFGLAIQHKDGDEMDTAPFMGSLAYMSPEQCENKPLDGRSDIYALGILLYQLATGQLPFQINAPADIMKHLNETPLPPSLINPSLPEILETITLKAIEKKPGDRYQSAAEMAHALRQALANPELQTAVLAQTSSNVVTQWLDNKWIAAIDVADRVDIHQTWTSLGKNRLFIVHQYEESQVIGLDEDEITIGREAGNNVVLDDQSVSGKHIRLLRTPQGWSVSDLGSTNHSYLGERMLEYEQVYDWPSNEALRMGPYFLRWQPFAADHRQKVAPILAGAALAGAAVAGAALLTSDPEPDPLSAAAAGDPDLTPEYSDGEVLGIAITPPTLELDPEAQSLLELSITNRDVTVKDVTMRLEENGRPPTWVSLTDYHMKLLPDETKSTTALVDLSQAPTILADLHVIKLIATTDKGEVEITDVQVTVNSQEEFTLDMHPSNLQEKVTCRLTISDQSNFQNEYTIMGIDDSDALIFEFDEPQNAILTNFDDQQQQIKVAPRQEAWLGFRIQPRKRPLLGANKILPFKIRVRTPETDWQSLTGQVEIEPRITRRVFLIFLLLLLLIGGTAYLAFYQYQTAQAERYAELQGQLVDAEARAQASQEQIDTIDAEIEAAIAAGATEEEIAALEAEKAAEQAILDAAQADAAALGNEVATAAEEANIDPTAAAEEAAATADAEAAATAAAEAEATAAAAEAATATAAEATAIAASFTPTPTPNNPPTDIEFSASSITENVDVGTVVGEFTAVDPDVASAGGNTVAINKSRLSRIAQQSDEFTYSLVSGSGSTHNDYFTINGSQLVTVVDINYEEVSSLSFRVEVADAAGDTYEESFTISVIDTDDIPQLSIADVTVSEADGTAEITVSVSGDNYDAATVDYGVADGTAVAGTDYTTTSGTFSWDKGDTGDQVITVAILDNDIDQTDRTFVVTLSNANNATISSGSATVTITDDDDKPTLSISNLTVSESVTGGKATITVQLTGASSEAVTVDYATADDTATDGTTNDYIATSGTLSWAAEATGAVTFDVTINDDSLHEPDETFTIALSNSTNATISDSEATITISDDNDSPKITIGDVTLTEGDTQITVPVTMTGKTSEEVWVEYSTSNGSGSTAATADYPDPDFDSTIGRLTWDAGTEGTQNITIQVNDDDIDEVDQEFFVVSLYDNSSSVVLQDTAGNIYILDNDDEPTISLENLSSSPVSENASNIEAAVTVDGRSSREITLYYSTQNGTATGGEDYTAVTNGTLTWSALDTNAESIRLTILDDETDEDAEETFVLTLNSANNAQIDSSNDSTNIVIQDDDPAPVISASVSNSGVDEDVASGQVIVSVDLDRPSTRTITVTYVTVDSTAVAGEDFVYETNDLTWNPGEEDPIEVTISVTDDETYENDEEFIFRLQNQSSSASIGTADTLVEIRNDDSVPIISVTDSDPVTVPEDVDTVDLSVALDRATSIPITVDWSTQASADARAGSDYTFADGTLTWDGSSALTQVITLIIQEDQIDELDESFTVVLENATVDTIATNIIATNSDVTTITITDNDDTPVLEIGDIAVIEGDNTDTPAFNVPVTMTRSSYLTVTVDYGITGGTAVSGTDYNDTGSGTLTWAPETTGQQTIPLQILSDNLDEGDSETVTLLIQNVTPNDAAIIVDDTATATITDDDDPPEISISVSDVYEDVGSAVVDVIMTGESGSDISVDYEDTSGGSATASQDYTSVSDTLTWPAGTSRVLTFTISINDDNLDEQPFETMNLLLSGINPVNRATFGEDTATLAIFDDDYTPVITATQSRSVDEDASAGNIGSPILASDGDDITLQDWTITPGNAYFSINSSGQISLTSAGAAALDYETQTNYVITLTVSDGTNTSDPETVTINVQDVDDEVPVVSRNDGLTVNEGATVTLTVSSHLDATDVDSDDNQLLFSIGSGPSQGYLDNGIITGTTGITFTRQMLANEDVSYTHLGSDTTSDSFTFTVTDPAGNAAITETFTITVTPVNDPPVLDLGGAGGGFATTFTEDGGTVAIVDNTDLNLFDSDSTNMASATITITNLADGPAEVLAVITTGTIITTYNSSTGVLQLTGPDTLANFQQVLRTITYDNTSQAPDTSTRDIQFVVNDGDDNSIIVSSAVTMIAQNDNPVLDLDADDSSGVTNGGFATTFAEDGGAVSIVDTDLSLTDDDSTNMASATITITNLADGTAEMLAATIGDTSITAVYNSGTGVLQLTGTDTLTNYEEVLRTITYDNTSQAPDTSTRDIQFVVNDGDDNSIIVSSAITLTDQNDNPVLDLDADDSSGVTNGGFATTFTEDGGAVSIVDTDLSLTDDDSTNMASATITITNLADGTAEMLAATTGDTSITAVYNSGTGVLQLTGTDTLFNYEDVLRTITYDNTSQAPDTTTRDIQFVVNDGAGNSIIVSSAITMIAQNDAPLLDSSSNLTLTSIISNTAAPAGDRVSTILASAGTDPITDADNGAVEGIAVIDDCVENPCSGTWEYSTDGGSSWIEFPNNVAANQAVLLAADDYIRFIPNTDFTGTRSIQFRAWDRTTGSSGDTSVDTTTNGGTTAFSTATETAAITVTMN